MVHNENLNLVLEFINECIQLLKRYYEQPEKSLSSKAELLNGCTTLNNMDRKITEIHNDFSKDKVWVQLIKTENILGQLGGTVS